MVSFHTLKFSTAENDVLEQTEVQETVLTPLDANFEFFLQLCE
jgi:hypothetical protein